MLLMNISMMADMLGRVACEEGVDDCACEVNRMEAMSIVRTSDAAYRERSPAFMQGVPRGCACRGGAFDHARSFEGILDEVSYCVRLNCLDDQSQRATLC